jgi:hypothetical protein
MERLRNLFRSSTQADIPSHNKSSVNSTSDVDSWTYLCISDYFQDNIHPIKAHFPELRDLTLGGQYRREYGSKTANVEAENQFPYFPPGISVSLPSFTAASVAVLVAACCHRTGVANFMMSSF